MREVGQQLEHLPVSPLFYSAFAIHVALGCFIVVFVLFLKKPEASWLHKYFAQSLTQMRARANMLAHRDGGRWATQNQGGTELRLRSPVLGFPVARVPTLTV